MKTKKQRNWIKNGVWLIEVAGLIMGICIISSWMVYREIITEEIAKNMIFWVIELIVILSLVVHRKAMPDHAGKWTLLIGASLIIIRLLIGSLIFSHGENIRKMFVAASVLSIMLGTILGRQKWKQRR